MRQIISSGVFEHCHFCNGRGCIACPGERKKLEIARYMQKQRLIQGEIPLECGITAHYIIKEVEL